MRLAELVTAADLKDINYLLLLEGAKQVGGGVELRKRTKARAKMVSDAKLAELLIEIPEVPRTKARAAWSHWMALVTVRQPFFDANHRTALMAFNLATNKTWSFEYSLGTADLEAMMIGSRKLVKQAHRPAADAPRMATVTALRNPDHPARQFYAGFEAKLKENARKT
ncbi:MAG TPA: hypothetical protein VM327_02740 [Candidatus Thermoplasmatota archaeon]|nr:hypothetical protein [Candidatus Thermoplasmatota archaeon]